jgi:KDO2-lipid IV(A) lauroyltransferase
VKARHVLEDRLVGTVGGLLRPLSRRAVLALGRRLGRAFGEVDRRHVAVAMDNMRRAFPEWEEGRLARAAREMYAHFGAVLLELLWMRGRSREEIVSFVDLSGREHVEAAMARGCGVVFPTAHIGSWEVNGLAHGYYFGAFDVVARHLDNPLLDGRLTAIRGQGGNTVVFKQKALARIMTTLRGGGGVGILVDQNVQEKDGIFVEFFGRPAATTTVAAALAVKTGCALVPGHTEMGPDGRYRLHYDPPLEWTASGDRQADVARLTQAMTRAIEGWVRAAPEQWLWMHRRWKTQPAREAPGGN